MKGKFCFSLLLCLLTSLAWSQTRRVAGRVTSDSAASGLAGVNVTVKGARTGTVTDARGEFSIAVPDNGKSTLVFSSVGYNSQEVSVGNKSTINLALTSSSSTLNDVVVIGYQTVRRKDLTASVSSIGAKDLKDVPLTSAAEALNGRLAGVTATTSEGSPDAQVRIRVRGGISITQNNDPLYIVDGVQVENALSIIAPQDIQSIDVLKDAAATAIYGARGANGVIVITTKTGRPGRTVVTYNGYVGVRKLAKELEVMSPYDFVLWQYEVDTARATYKTGFVPNYGSTWDTLNVYKNVSPIDWQKEVMGRTGVSTTHNVSASGGNKKITYNFGYTFNNEKPIVQNSVFNRHILNVKADYNATSKLKIGITGRYLNQDVTGAGTSDGSTSYARLRNAVKYTPFFTKDVPLDASDPSVINPGNGVMLVNPIALSNAEYRRKTTLDYNFSATASYQITKQLNFRSTFGYDQNNFVDRRFFDSITAFSTNQGGGRPVVQLDTTYRKTINNSNVFTYSVRNWKNKHTFDVLLGEETYDLRNDQRSGQFSGYPKFTSHADAFSNQPGTLGALWPGYPVYVKSRYTNLSFFGRINYNFSDRYLLSLNARYDGASKFLHPWGFFPGGSFAWRVKREKFMENVDFINDLKFRVGYGKIGNNRISDYLFLTTFVYGTSYYGLNNVSNNAYTQNYLANSTLQWESLVNRNIGVDISILKNRLSMSVDVYNNTSDNLLLNAKIAPTFGFTTQLQNVGATSNKGVELQLSANILQSGRGLNWTANFNISHNKNRVEALSLGQTDYPAGPAWGISGQPNDYLNRVGYPVGSMFGWISDGFYKVSDFNYDLATTRYTLKPGVPSMSASLGSNVVPGAERFKDLNGDGVIDNNDRTIIGDPTPKFSGGLNQQFTYKNWDASVFVNFSYGNKIYNANKIEFTSGYNVTSNLLAIMNNRWKTIDASGNVIETFKTDQGVVYAYGAAPDVLAKANANATIWMPAGFNVNGGASFGSGNGNFSYYPSSWAIEDGSFLRLSNVTVGYTIRPHKIVTRLRFYVTGNNLAIWTNYTGYDPEVSVASSGLTPGLDYSAYPKSRLYLFGVQATF